MRQSREEAAEIAEFWAGVLGIKGKRIVVLFGSERNFAQAQICKPKEGKVVDDLCEDYDTIEITLLDISKFELPEWIDKQQFISRIFHELLHIRYPNWDEERIKDYEVKRAQMKLLSPNEPEKQKAHAGY